MGDLSEHSSKAEFACHCSGELVIDPALISALERLRALAGKPIKVHAGYRCAVHKQQVGGVTDSEHTRGIPADIDIPGRTLQQIYELALQVPAFFAGGIGVYAADFCLCTCEPTARWARVRGQYVGIQHPIQEPLTLLAKIQSPTRPG